MNTGRAVLLFSLSGAFIIAAWIATHAVGTPSREARAAAESGPQMRSAATAFLGSLDPRQKKLASFKFSDAERFNWHFIPRERKGLSLKDMRATQRGALDTLLDVALTRVGLKTVEYVRSLETVLASIEGPDRRFPRDPLLYFVSFFGTPDGKKSWGWRFEGHHLCLNFTLAGDRIVSGTPLFFGANPALVKDGPLKGVRVLPEEEEIARRFMGTLNEKQKKAALGAGKPVEVAGTKSKTYGGPLPRGVAVKDLEPEQTNGVKLLLNAYLKYLAPDIKRAILRRAGAAGFENVQVSWRGSLEPGKGHSYIVHGPTFVLSYANFQNDALHVHSGFRDLAGGFDVVEGK